MVKRLQFHHYGAHATTRDEWRDAIRGRKPFRAGHMSGSATHRHAATGDLPEPYRSQFRNGNPDYAVFSYDTPIAWHDADTDRWTFPHVNYSITTTQHQHTALMAVDTYDPEGGWARDYETGPYVNRREGKGRSPYGPRRGW